jgi:hypothetical protein
MGGRVKSATIRVTATCGPDELAALLWDAMASTGLRPESDHWHDGNGNPCITYLMPKATVRKLVSARLLETGRNSVCCGPSNGADEGVPYTPEAERACISAVCRAYSLEWPRHER